MHSLIRVPTGIAGLDRVLGGGLFQGRLYLVAGGPGTGKTVLANQVAFHHGHRGGRTIYVTLLTESHGQMLGNLGSLSFFDQGLIGTNIRYLSAYRAAQDEGLEGIFKLIEGAVRQGDRATWASLLVLDGTAAIEEAAISALEFRRFLNRLRALVEVTKCTAIINLPGLLKTHEPLFTMADGVFELTATRAGMRAARELSVAKFRGASYLEGWHMLEIDERGVTIHPRTETVLAHPAPVANRTRERVTWGVPGLDAMLHGGLPEGSTTAILGAPGSGKTLLSSCFLAEGVRREEAGLHVSLYERPENLIDHAEEIGIPFARYRDEGRLHILWLPPVELLLDPFVERVLETVHRHRVRRLVIDSVDALRDSALHPARLAGVLAAVIYELRARGVTTVLTAESPLLGAATPENQQLSALAENQIMVRFVEIQSHLHRFLSIMKIRGSGYDTSLREFRISSRGFEVATTFESAEAILTGVARMRGEPSAGDDRTGGHGWPRS